MGLTNFNKSTNVIVRTEVAVNIESEYICILFTHCMNHIFTSCKMSIFNSSNFRVTLFHSLGWNKVGDSGATALADVLSVNQSLKMLK